MRITAEQEAQPDQPQQRRDLGEREHVLHGGAGADAARVDDREQNHDRAREQLLCGQTDLAGSQQIVVRRDRGQEDAGVFGEGHRDGCDGAGLDDGEERPAVEEAPEASEGFAQVDVLAAGVWHGRGQFAVAERRDDGEGRADEPAENEQAGDFTWRATSALTMKMPEPIIEPITSVVAETSPRPCTKVGCFAGVIQ